MFKQDILTIGDILIDMVAPDARSLDTATVFYRAAGGAPANAAVAAARLGATSAFIGAIGRDAFGQFLRDLLRLNGVQTDGLVEVAFPTTLALVANNRGGIPDFVFYHGSDSELHPEQVSEDSVARSRFLCAGLTAMTLEPTRSAVYAAVRIARLRQVLICIDPNLRPSSWGSMEEATAVLQPMLDAAHILKVNDEEAWLLTGERDPERAIRALGTGERLVVITLGGDGCLWYRNGVTGRVRAPSVEVLDTTGAGDAFLGAFLAELARKGVEYSTFENVPADHIEEACSFACAAAAFACTQLGAMASLPAREDAMRLMAAGQSS